MQITKFSHLVYYYIYVEHMQNYMSIYMHIYSKNKKDDMNKKNTSLSENHWNSMLPR